MILLVSTCTDSLHELEFVKPIKKIIEKNAPSGKNTIVVKHYEKISNKDIQRAKKIIICGTSLQDNQCVKDIKKFEWIKDTNKPILGICSGMHLMGLTFGGKLKKQTEIGLFYEDFKPFLGLKGKREVYHLHNHFVDFKKLKEFEVFSKGAIPQAVKHKTKDIFGVLFHPEVRNREVIVEFLSNA